jgi:glycogen debranching enzyme
MADRNDPTGQSATDQSATDQSATDQSATDESAGQKTTQDPDHLGTHTPDLGQTTTLKSGAMFMVTLASGDVPAQSARIGRHGLGLYFHDTRFLDEKRMHVNGRPMTLLFESADLGDRCTRELTNPELPVRDDSGDVIHKETIGVHVDTTLNSEVREVLTFRNFCQDPLEVTLTLAYGSDFDDIFTVRGMSPGKRGRVDDPKAEAGVLRLGYLGADRRRRTTEISFDPPPASIGGTCATYHLSLAPGAPQRVEVVFRLTDEPTGESDEHLELSPTPVPVGEPDESGLLGLSSSKARMTTSNELFNRVMRRSFLDLGMLETWQGDDRFFAAGVPWYVALFGRDSIITALQTLAFAPEVGRATLELLARYQGSERDPDRDEEPGKILHELRVGERARLGEVPFTPYYGTVDATPLFLILLGEYLQWTGDLDCFTTLRPQVDAALEWIERDGDPDGDGLFEYVSRASDGLVNQGWKDSYNSIVNADGSLARPPIALVEMQGYVFRAFRAVANVCRATGDEDRAAELERRADELRDRFEERFWSPKLGNYAMALHGDPGDKQPADVDASNQGQALWGGIVAQEHAGAVRDSIMDPERLNAGWGVRTLSKSAVAYNPFDYQTGAIWPHDSAMVAVGLRTYRFDDEALEILTGLYEAATRFDLYRLPELFAGFDRDTYGRPVRYPVACSPQAWAAGSLPYLLTAVLGIVPDAFASTLHIVRPRLPGWLDWVEIKGLTIGASHVDLRFERSEELTLAVVTSKSPDVQVKIEY